MQKSNYITKIITGIIFNINKSFYLLSIFIFYTDIHLKRLVDNICYVHKK